MDVNGFIMHVNRAVSDDVKAGRHPDHEHNHIVDNENLNIKIVSMLALGEAFSKYESWKDL